MQVGTQNRSNTLYQKAKEMVHKAWWARSIMCAHSGIATMFLPSPSGATVFPQMQAPKTRIGIGFLKERPSARGIRGDSTSGGFIGIIRAESPPTYSYTRPTSPTLFAVKHVLFLHGIGRHL